MPKRPYQRMNKAAPRAGLARLPCAVCRWKGPQERLVEVKHTFAFSLGHLGVHGVLLVL